MLLAATAALRLALATGLGPGNDEAYYYLYTVHPDWSYLDHPPGVGWVEAAGLALSGGVVAPWSLRLGFVALGTVAALLLARLTTRWFGPQAGRLAVAAWCATAYFGYVAGTFALPDGPLLACWLLALDRVAVALDRPERHGAWLAAGVAWGGALLCKYHALLLPPGVALYLLIAAPEVRRRCLRRPGPYLALAVGGLLFAPVVAWNATHEWASFAFQGGRAAGPGGWLPRPDRLAGFLAGQAAYLTPWMWAFLAGALWRRIRGGRGLSEPSIAGDSAGRARPHEMSSERGAGFDPERYLLCMALPPLVAFGMVACFRPVLPHWSLVGAVPLFPLLGADWGEWARRDPFRVRRRVGAVLTAPVVVLAIVAVQARWGPCPVPGDPTRELAGWDQVAGWLDRGGWTDRPGTFLFTSSWYESGQLALATGRRRPDRVGSLPVLCYNAHDARGFAHWSRPEPWVGRDGVLVVVDPCSTEPAAYDRWFRRIEPLGALDVVRWGRTIRRVRFYHCRDQTRPFPFDGRPEPEEKPVLTADRGGNGTMLDSVARLRRAGW